MNEHDLVARRMRVHLMADIESLAQVSKPSALYDTELGQEVSSFGKGEHGAAPALTAEETAAAKILSDEINALWDQAHKLKQERTGGKVVHGLEPEDLVSLGWFDKVHPLAQSTFVLFEKRGWLDEELWPA